MVPVDVTVDGVESLLSNLDQSKVGRPDEIPAKKWLWILHPL